MSCGQRHGVGIELTTGRKALSLPVVGCHPDLTRALQNAGAMRTGIASAITRIGVWIDARSGGHRHCGKQQEEQCGQLKKNDVISRPLCACDNDGRASGQLGLAGSGDLIFEGAGSPGGICTGWKCGRAGFRSNPVGVTRAATCEQLPRCWTPPSREAVGSDRSALECASAPPSGLEV